MVLDNEKRARAPGWRPKSPHPNAPEWDGNGGTNRIEASLGSVYWLREAMATERPLECPPLAKSITADVCIVGGGYTGLWAAIEVREQAPDACVVLVESTQCGFGASGRNGGWATGWHDELDSLVERFGDKEALRLATRSSWAIDRIESFCAEHEIDCHFRRKGALWTASSRSQLGSWNGAVDACDRLGRSDRLEIIDGDDLRRRTGSPVLLAGVRQTDAASVQPALLVRGLRRAAIDLGVHIYESTPMIALDRGHPAVVRTPAGSVTTGRVVIATGAWSTRFLELRRAVIPIGSHIIVTEPLGEELAKLEWSNGELLGDSRLMVHYAMVSTDGRIVFGRGGGSLGSFGRVSDRHFYDRRALEEVARDFRRWFPQFANTRITHGWGGPVDRAPGHLPFVGCLNSESLVVYGLGYSGNGVAPSALIGRMLGRVALGEIDDDTEGPLAKGPPGYLPPEPIRTIGGAAVRAAVQFVEDRQELGLRPWALNGALHRLVATSVPAVLDPRRWHGRDNHRQPPERVGTRSERGAA